MLTSNFKNCLINTNIFVNLKLFVECKICEYLRLLPLKWHNRCEECYKLDFFRLSRLSFNILAEEAGPRQKQCTLIKSLLACFQQRNNKIVTTLVLFEGNDLKEFMAAKFCGAKQLNKNPIAPTFVCVFKSHSVHERKLLSGLDR